MNGQTAADDVPKDRGLIRNYNSKKLLLNISTFESEKRRFTI